MTANRILPACILVITAGASAIGGWGCGSDQAATDPPPAPSGRPSETAPTPFPSSTGTSPRPPTLPPEAFSYRLPPPNTCYDDFWVQGCEPGNAASACGGQCSVANACSPPEDPNKAHLPKTFVCPRFMLFSREMAAAAQDDAVANGWEQGAFNYAVVGHDADAGGLDGAATSSCCQCYQLVFEKPEPGSPQPPELPIPKPLIVQSFNTAAGGPKNFDVFMGVGGFGAFNACVNDPTFSNTTKFGEFLYSAYPSEFPGNGGVKFLSYDECRSAGAVTVESLQSATCQARIASACGGVRSSIPAIAQDTVDSCVRSNRVASLYHQNWEVRARRVECPEALTRVTGCRLRAQGLPSPDPRVQTVQQADASFRPGYTTTTMQDCCKPSCAWKNLVEGMGVPADPDYRSFYSCDAAGAPITAQ